MPDGATFNGQQDIYTTEEAARLRAGDPLADPALNPLVYPVGLVKPAVRCAYDRHLPR
jgi:hypothetical protein